MDAERRISELEAVGLASDKSRGRLAHARHIIRLVALLTVAFAGALVARAFLVPPTYGQLGHYRAAALGELASRPTRHMGSGVCGECHDKALIDKHDHGKHATVACETCHGPAAGHAMEPEGRTKMIVDTTASLCLRCHDQVPGRPKSFPQVNATAHIAEVSGAAPTPDMQKAGATTGCTSCHDAHDGSI